MENTDDLWDALISSAKGSSVVLKYSARHWVYWQGEVADSVYYLREGKVAISTFSPQGKEVILGLVEGKNFFGHGCLADQKLRVGTAKTMTDCTLLGVKKEVMKSILGASPWTCPQN